MLRVKWLKEIMEEQAPKNLALEYDNVGLLVGDTEKEISKVLVALDLTEAVCDEAIALGASAVVTHHPIIFRAIKKITTEDTLGRRLIKLIKNDIAVYASHTNLDIASGGTNDVLFEKLELCNKKNLEKNELSLGRIGDCNPISLEEFAQKTKKSLGLQAVAVSGDLSRTIKTVGICTGSGSDVKLFASAKSGGCDVFVTGDITYHDAQAALEMGLALIDATHYGTEVIVVETLKNYIQAKANETGNNLEVVASGVNGQVSIIL